MARLYYQGHGSFRIVSACGTVAYFEPYLGDGYGMPCDAVFISHEHHDHTKTELLIMKADCKVFRGKDMTDGKRYDEVKVKDFSVKAVPAYNKNHKREECVGFLIEVDGVKVYASGDTSTTEYMKSLKKEKLDYALFCADGIYNMDATEASRCAKIIGAKYSIPYHTYPENLFSEEVASRFKAKGKITLRPGNEIDL